MGTVGKVVDVKSAARAWMKMGGRRSWDRLREIEWM